MSLSDKKTKQIKTNKSFLILGMGFFGAELAEQLYKLGAEVIGVDTDPQIVASMADKLTQAIELNPADEQALESLGIPEFDVCVIARGSNLEDSVSIAISLKELGAKRIIGRTVRRKHAEILKKLGVEETIFPEIEIADYIAEKLVRPRIHDKIIFNNDVVIEALIVFDNMQGLLVKEFQKRIPRGVTLLGIQRGDNYINDYSDDITLQKDDFIIVWGKSEKIREIEK